MIVSIASLRTLNFVRYRIAAVAWLFMPLFGRTKGSKPLNADWRRILFGRTKGSKSLNAYWHNAFSAKMRELRNKGLCCQIDDGRVDRL
jgi:hypothetical protein